MMDMVPDMLLAAIMITVLVYCVVEIHRTSAKDMDEMWNEVKTGEHDL